MHNMDHLANIGSTTYTGPSGQISTFSQIIKEGNKRLVWWAWVSKEYFKVL
jgi:hypothetical protein